MLIYLNFPICSKIFANIVETDFLDFPGKIEADICTAMQTTFLHQSHLWEKCIVHQMFEISLSSIPVLAALMTPATSALLEHMDHPWMEHIHDNNKNNNSNNNKILCLKVAHQRTTNCIDSKVWRKVGESLRLSFFFRWLTNQIRTHFQLAYYLDYNSQFIPRINSDYYLFHDCLILAVLYQIFPLHWFSR